MSDEVKRNNLGQWLTSGNPKGRTPLSAEAREAIKLRDAQRPQAIRRLVELMSSDNDMVALLAAKALLHGLPEAPPEEPTAAEATVEAEVVTEEKAAHGIDIGKLERAVAILKQRSALTRDAAAAHREEPVHSVEPD